VEHKGIFENRFGVFNGMVGGTLTYLLQDDIIDNNHGMDSITKIRDIVDACRQRGSSTELIRAAATCDGTIIVLSQGIKLTLEHLMSKLNLRVSIRTIQDAHNNLNSLKGPIFFDTTIAYAPYGVARETAEISSKKLTSQVNTRVTDKDTDDLNKLNEELFDGDAKQSMIARIAMRKGIEALMTEIKGS
jgi:hypothetical protein